MSYNSDLEQVRKKAEIQGWRYSRTSSGHHQFYSPDKESIVTTSGTPSDTRGWLNFLADMKRAGYKDDFGVLKTPIQQLIEKREEPAPAPSPPPVIESTPNVGVKAVNHVEISIADHVRSLLSNKPEQVFSIDEVFAKVQAVRKDAKRTAVSQALKGIVDEKQGYRAGDSIRSGLYQWGVPKPALEGRYSRKPKRRSKAKVKFKVRVPRVASATGIDQDLKDLLSAIEAMGKVIDVVNRLRERLTTMGEVKKVMGW